MAYKLDLGLPIQNNIKRIIRELDEKIIEEITHSKKSKHEIIHFVRKRCKEIRGTLRLIRPKYELIYKKENICYRDAARELSFVRDAQSVIEALDGLMKHFKNKIDKSSHQFVYEHLISRRDKIMNDQEGLETLLNIFSTKIEKAKGRINFWPIKKDGFVAINKGLQKTYSRGRKAMIIAYKKPTTENFHEWRKRVKYHWFHLQLITPLWPNFIDSYITEVEQLAEYLGDEHDLATLKETISINDWPYDKKTLIDHLYQLIDERRAEIKNIAYPMGQRLFFEEPESMALRFEYYWSVKQKESTTF